MTPQFLVGLLVCFLGIPFGVARLMQAGAVDPPDLPGTLLTGPWPNVTVVPLPTAFAVTPGDLDPPAGLDETPDQDSPTGELTAPDLDPDATPEQVKAGEVRRVPRTPCHDCPCCQVYATRMETSHDEIDRLRDELVRGDGHRLRLAASRTTPGGFPS